ncbi:hypothetical protein SRHO_G00048610 [Serrasalmus rhombeus]
MWPSSLSGSSERGALFVPVTALFSACLPAVKLVRLWGGKVVLLGVPCKDLEELKSCPMVESRPHSPTTSCCVQRPRGVWSGARAESERGGECSRPGCALGVQRQSEGVQEEVCEEI